MTVVDWSSSPPGFCSGSSPPPQAENREKKMTSEWWWFRQVFTISFKCICTKWVWLSTSTTVALLTMQVCSSRQIFWKEIACKLLYKSQKSGKTFFISFCSLLWELESSASFLGDGRRELAQGRCWCLGNTGPRLESSVKFCLQVALEKELLEQRISGSHLVCPWVMVTPRCHPAELQGLRLLEAVPWLQATQKAHVSKQGYAAFKGKEKSSGKQNLWLWRAESEKEQEGAGENLQMS